jgi:hypothetical protein
MPAAPLALPSWALASVYASGRFFGALFLGGADGARGRDTGKSPPPAILEA